MTLPLSNSDQTCFGLSAKLIATEIKTNVRDNSYRSDRDVVAGTGDVVHNGWIYSHPSRVGGGVDLVTRNTGPPDRLKRYEFKNDWGGSGARMLSFLSLEPAQ